MQSTFTDTHCHLNMMVEKEFDAPLRPEHLVQIAHIVEQAAHAGVGTIINVGTSLEETRNAVLIAQQHENVWASAGIHPCDVAPEWHADFKKLERLVRDKQANKIIAIGETGLDFFHKPFFKERQIAAFRAQIELSIEHNLPLVIHSRESADEVLRVLDDVAPQVSGTLHCFLQREYVARQAIEWGFVLGIDGPITYPKNEWLRILVRSLPLEHLVLETDAPFLPPQHMRGKKNGPQHLPSFGQVVADLKNVTLSELAQITSQNVKRVFGI